ncbi:sheath polysaccharide-degrading enzyme [Streptomyces sp. NBC_01808]|uniref:right-handed parallel beta-helix repeat-containing protein n=1 Tax=Streptomyces sp. NBC_01808 TaxID=2975947 RepID=UPI002DDC7CEB|nr:right-handed parallel beta-helix repeat-containing protein [Streptomyces sp. NBC_01808]WSA36482.1 sheath polysaccharide-degrading enzyme [Streptomyces sp. NBC_01808]
MHGAHSTRIAAALVSAAALLGGFQAAAAARPADAAEVIDVSTADELEAALAAAGPGDTIRMADGTYRGNFDIAASGSGSAPATLTGSAGAVLVAGGGYGLHLDGASYWNLTGFTVTGGQKGIVMDAADHVDITSVTVHDLDMEAVHFRDSSSDGSITASRIHDTGRNGRGMGEGVYVGSAGGTGDRSDRILIEGNTIGPGVGGENVDIKEGTTGARIIGNTFDGSGLTGANYDDSWVDIKGNDVLVAENTGRGTTNDGYQTHEVQDGWGCNATFRGNRSDLGGATGPDRYAINVTNYDARNCPVTVSGSNTVSGGRGLVNPGIPVTG